MERIVEKMFYASRWLLAPIYLGLSLALVLLAFKFFQEVFHFLPIVFSVSESELVLGILSMVDMALVAVYW